jgi:hypothetical protein
MRSLGKSLTAAAVAAALLSSTGIGTADAQPYSSNPNQPPPVIAGTGGPYAPPVYYYQPPANTYTPAPPPYIAPIPRRPAPRVAQYHPQIRRIAAGTPDQLVAAPAPATPAKSLEIRSEIEKSWAQLRDVLKFADQLPERVKAVMNKTPQDMQAEIAAISAEINSKSSIFAENGALFTSLTAFRQKAVENRQRVEGRKDLDAADRDIALESWDSAIRELDAALGTMKGVRERLQILGQRARQKQAGLAEILLAGQAEALAKSINAWLTELDAAIRELHGTFDATIGAKSS